MKKIIQNFIYLFTVFLITESQAKLLDNFIVYSEIRKFMNNGYDNMAAETNGEHLVLSNLLPPRGILFDAGASRGEWSKCALSYAPDAIIYAFEPIPSSFNLLKNNLGDRINCYQLALSNISGIKTFHCCLGSIDNNQLSSFYKRPILEHKFHFKTTPIEVTADSIDLFCARENIDYIDFLKIDTEGAELEILQGAQKMLRKQKIKCIQFEYGGCYIDAKTTLKDACVLLTKNNYSIFRILSNGLLHIDQWDKCLENYLYSNYLAIAADEATPYGLIENL